VHIYSKLLFAVITLFGFTAPAMALNIFTCEPEWAALAKEIAPTAKIDSAATAYQDPHYVQARPSLIAKIRKADLLICSGAELEIGWLPALLMRSNNAKVSDPNKGLIYAAEHVERLDQLSKVDRSMGDVHAMGNPHVHLSPDAIATVAKVISQRLALIDADNASLYREAELNFQQRWQQSVKQWQVQSQALKGMQLLAYHTSYRYLFEWLSIEQIGDLEPKPGLAPTSGHLASLLELIKGKPAKAVVYTAYQDEKPAQWLSNKAKIHAQKLAFTVEKGQSLFELYQSAIDELLEINANGS